MERLTPEFRERILLEAIHKAVDKNNFLFNQRIEAQVEADKEIKKWRERHEELTRLEALRMILDAPIMFKMVVNIHESQLETALASQDPDTGAPPRIRRSGNNWPQSRTRSGSSDWDHSVLSGS